MKKLTKNTLCFLMVLPLIMTAARLSAGNDTERDITAYAEEGEEGGEGNAEDPGEEPPPEDEPTDPGEEPSEDEPEEPGEEPTDEPPATEEPGEDETNAVTGTTESDDDDTDISDDESSDSDSGAHTTKKKKKLTTVSKAETEKTTSTETTVSSVPEAVNNVMTMPKPDKTENNSPSAGVAAVAAAALAAVTAFTVIRVRMLRSRKLEYYPGDEYDEDNCPTDALRFNSKYGKYNACAVTDYENRIILTFEPDYDTKYITKILDVLKEKKVSAVFFLNGSCVKKQSDLIERMIKEGHILGNYGMTDASMPDMKTSALREAIIKLHEYVIQKFGYEMRYLRPPYGEYSAKTLATAKDMGYETLMWSYTYADYEDDDIPDKGTATAELVEAAHSGGIYLLRSVTDADAEILADAIDVLRDKGYTF